MREFATLVDELNADAALREPIEIGETTTIGEKLITGLGYLPAPDPFLVTLSALTAQQEIKEVTGRAFNEVTHVVLRDPRDLEEGRKHEGVYVTFMPVPTVESTAGLSPAEIDATVSAMEYIRVG